MSTDVLEPRIFKQAVEDAYNHIIITDAKGHIIYANKAVERITGYTQDEILRHTPALWGQQMKPEFYASMWHRLREEKKPFVGEVINKRKNGQKYYAKVTISPLFATDDPEKIIGYVGTEEDITLQKELEKERNEFFSMTAHNLRTPLGTMSWNLELVLNQQNVSEDKSNELLKRVYDTNDNLIAFVNDLLHVFEIQDKTYVTSPSDIEVRAVLQSIYKKIETVTNLKQVSISDDAIPENTRLIADKNCFTTVARHLIRNAVHYSKDGDVVTISLQERTDDVMFSVRDTGIGIADEDKNKMFTQFFHSSRTIDTNFTVGLGLFIVKTWMDYIGGSVWFESEVDKGSTFYCAFPKQTM